MLLVRFQPTRPIYDIQGRQQTVGIPARLQNFEMSAVALRTLEFLQFYQDIFSIKEGKVVRPEAFFWLSVVRRARQRAAVNPHCD